MSSEHGVVRLSLAVAVIVWYTFIWSLNLLGCYTGRKRYRLRPRSPLATASPSSVPGVSILRPLKGLDTNLYENLESTFAQEYPNFEIFLCVADEHDQALGVVRDLIAKYPTVNAHVVIGEEVVGVNPKVNNLMRSYRQAANDILWVIDSNVTIAPGTLARSVDALDGPHNPSASSSHRRIALVHHIPFAWASEYALGSRIEEACLNTYHAKMYLAINTVAIESCVTGKSCMYRRSDLERCNGSLKPATSDRDADGDSSPGERGLAAFGKFLGEDNMIGAALWHELGLRHELSCDVARNAVNSMSLADFFWRRVRWIRVRKRMVLLATIVEPFTESVVLGLLVAYGTRFLFGLPPWLFLIIHFALWLWVDMDVFASLAGHPVPETSRWSFIAAWVAREVTALPIWIFAIAGNEVTWRGRRYEVMRNGEVRRVSPGSMSWWDSWRSRKPTSDNYEPLDLAQD